MSSEPSKMLTQQWILGMIYPTPRDLQYLVEHGCKRMVFGLESFDELQSIINELVDNNQIQIDSNKKLGLTASGIFDMQKYTIQPLLQLVQNPDSYKHFIENKLNACDIEFLESLQNEDERIAIRKISEYTENHVEELYHTLGNI